MRDSTQSVRIDDARLDRLVADERIERARRERSREFGLRQAAAEETTIAGITRALAERERPVTILVANGRRHRGRLIGVGADHVVLVTPERTRVVVALRAVQSVRTDRAIPAVTQHEHGGGGSARRMCDNLTEAAEQRHRVRLVTSDDSDALAGELISVGRDVATLRLDDGAGLAYVPLASLVEFSATASG